MCKVSAGGEPTSARSQRRAAPSPALAPGGRGGAQRPGCSEWPRGGAGGGGGSDRSRAGRLFHTPQPRASELSGGAGRGRGAAAEAPPRPRPAPPRWLRARSSGTSAARGECAKPGGSSDQVWGFGSGRFSFCCCSLTGLRNWEGREGMLGEKS